MKKAISRKTRIIALFAAVAMLLGFGVALADEVVNSTRPVIVSDDITKRATDVVSASGAQGGGGKGNNGHGNNTDGVDSSNPGKGGGGPNGAVDPSGGTDDEGKGGGSIMSKGKGGGKK